MGNSSGKDKAQKPEEVVPPIPEIQQAEEKAKKAAQDLKNSPQVQKIEEKARQAAETLKQSAAVQEGEKKLKEATESAQKNQPLQKIEEAGKALAGKAKQTVEKIEDKAKEVAGKAKEVAEKAKHSIESAPIEGQVKAAEQDFRQTVNNFAKEASANLTYAQNFACAHYRIAKREVRNINIETPIAIAAFKRDYIFPIDQRVRMAGHYGLTALTLLISFKARAGFFSSIRNTAFVGLTSGFFLYPESINPFRRENFPAADRDIEEYL